MSPDGSSRERRTPKPGARASSLTSVKLHRTQATGSGSEKTGDITAQLASTPEQHIPKKPVEAPEPEIRHPAAGAATPQPPSLPLVEEPPQIVAQGTLVEPEILPPLPEPAAEEAMPPVAYEPAPVATQPEPEILPPQSLDPIEEPARQPEPEIAAPAAVSSPEPEIPPPVQTEPRAPEPPPQRAVDIRPPVAPVLLSPPAPVERVEAAVPPAHVEPPVEAFAPRARPTLVPPALRAPVLQAAPVPPPPPPPPPQDARGGMEALLDYWVGLRRGHGVPPLANLDRGLVADRWRDCFLVTYGPMGAAAPKIARLSTPTGEIQYSPMVTEWIITTAKEAARHGEAMEDEQDFPHGSGAAGYRMLLLPFTTADGRSECVLCHLSRAPRQRARA